MGRAIGPQPAQAHRHIDGTRAGKALGDERRPECVPSDVFEPVAVPSWHAHAGMEVEEDKI